MSRFPRLPVPVLDPGAEAGDLDGAAALALLDRLLERFSAAYEALKVERGALDFDDLELRAGELLEERAGVRVAWSERFQLLMVDEFQDTNPRQIAILRALDTGNLFTVGDELQSIYGFRHADVELFRSRRAALAPGGGSLTLRGNFRSRGPLLAVVNALFAARMPGRYTSLVAAREDPRETGSPPAGERAPGWEDPPVELLLTDRSGWDRPELSTALADGLPPAASWRHAEARALARRVRELVDLGEAPPGGVVVLLRALGDISVYERALQLEGLATIAMVGSFWGRLQTRDLLAYLRALANPLDETSLYEALASPLAGITSDGLALLAEAARAGGTGAWDSAVALARGEISEGALLRLPAGDRERLAGFIGRVRDERVSAPSRPLAQLIERAMDASGYREHVLGLDWGERRLANVDKLLRLARRFESSEGRDLRAFLDHAERLREQRGASEPDAPVDSVEPDAVRLMTIHAAKGLEFPVVCVADLGRAPGGRPARLLIDGERVGLSLMRLDGLGATPTLEYDDLLAARRRAEAEEEDRILYVAMTRACDRLLLSGAVEFDGWPQERESSPPIAWLGPALAGGLPLPLSSGPAVCDLVIGPDEERALVRCRLNSPGTAGEVIAAGPATVAPASAGPAGGAHAGNQATTAGRGAAAPASAAAAGGAHSGPGEELREGSGARARAPREPLRTLSYTSLSLLERCGYRYYLERVLGLPEDQMAARRSEPRGGLEARARGILVHGLLEVLDFADARAPAPEDVGLLARRLGIAVTNAERAEIAGLIGAALDSPLAERIGRALDIRREHPFAFVLAAGQPLVSGVIDLLAAEGEGVVIVDYKSDRLGPGTDLEALVDRDYGVQRELYALALLRDGARAVEVVHWFLERPLEPVAATYAAAEADALRDRLRGRLSDALERGFAVSPNPHRALCLTCPGRAGLCSWGETETLRESPGDTDSPLRDGAAGG